MNPFKKILAMPNDSKPKTLFVAITLSLVCSILVAFSAVALKPLQESNKALDKKRNILQIAGLMEEDKSIDELFQQVEPKLVDVATGNYVTDIDPAVYDQRKAAGDPSQNITIAPKDDVASIKRRAKIATVYLVKENDTVKTVILPIHGYGLWSTLYGFIALEADTSTIVGFGYYQHAETPGLGGEVDNPIWKAKWIGKKVYDDNYNLVIDIVKGAANSDHPQFAHQVDGLSGATITSNGVENMLYYWLGQQGFAKYLENLRTTSQTQTAKQNVQAGDQS